MSSMPEYHAPEILADRPLKVIVLAKQIPVCEDMELDSDGRLIRSSKDGDAHMNDYCRRAVAMGHRIARASGGEISVVTMGPPQAENIIREALLYGVDSGVLLTDEKLAGSDTLATARALAGALEICRPFDLILCGRNSLDGDTGQVPPQIAQLLGLPFAGGVRELELRGETLSLGLEHNDEYCNMTVDLPAMLSCAERLIDPCKIKDPKEWAKADISKMTRLTAADLQGGNTDDDKNAGNKSDVLWGLAGSPTKVGKIKALKQNRLGKIFDGNATEAQLETQLNECAEIMEGLLERTETKNETEWDGDAGRAEGLDGAGANSKRNEKQNLTALLLLEEGRQTHSRELITKAAHLAKKVQIIATPEIIKMGGLHEPTQNENPLLIKKFPKNEIMPDDFANGVINWIYAQNADASPPDFILAPSTDWGREVASRIAASLGCGLVGDAIDIYISENMGENNEQTGKKARENLICLKPAFGGSMVAEIYCTSTPQMATIREGVFPINYPDTVEIEYPLIDFPRNSRITIKSKTRTDESSKLANADFVVGIGQGVKPEDIPEIARKVAEMGGELAATRKITDQKHLPRARQVGITGHSISPRIYVALGISGRFNHTVGLSQAEIIISINSDPNAEIFSASDIGVVGDYSEIFFKLLKNPKINSTIKSVIHQK